MSILVLIPISLFAYSLMHNCGNYQARLSYIIIDYYNFEPLEIKSIYPGKDFEDFYNKLLEKKYVDKPLSYETSKCSYGITIISDEPVIYCKYHGNSMNRQNYESIWSSIHFLKRYTLGFYVFLCCLVIGVFIIIVKKVLFKKI